MDKISFPYRASTHLTLLHVIAQSGAWERYGLDVDYDRQITKGDAHRLVSSGEIEFVGGNHVSTYAHRARGDNWVYLGQTLNSVHAKLVVRPDSGIEAVADLRGKRVGIRGTHPSLNDWLFLKQHGLDADLDQVELVKKVHGLENLEAASQLEGPGAEEQKKKKRSPLWHWVRDGDVDAAFLTAPSHLFAEQAGLKIIEIEPLPMIWYTTISSSLPFVRKNPDVVERFLKGIIEGIHFFKTRPEKSIAIIKERYTNEGQLTHSEAAYLYHSLAPLLEPKLYPTMAAIANVYEEAKHQDADAAKVNPMELWDLHHLRRIDDSGFAAALYAGQSAPAPSDDLDYDREQLARRAQIIADVKACGHLAGVECGCE